MAKLRLPGMASLRRWREAQNPTVEYVDIGTRLKCHPDQLRHFERGRRALPLEVAIPLHHLTGIPVEHLLTAQQRRVWARMAPATPLAPGTTEPTPVGDAA